MGHVHEWLRLPFSKMLILIKPEFPQIIFLRKAYKREIADKSILKNGIWKMLTY